MRTELENRLLAVLTGVYEAQKVARIVRMGFPENGWVMREVNQILDEHCPEAKRLVDLELETARLGGGV